MDFGRVAPATPSCRISEDSEEGKTCTIGGGASDAGVANGLGRLNHSGFHCVSHRLPLLESTMHTQALSMCSRLWGHPLRWRRRLAQMPPSRQPVLEDGVPRKQSFPSPLFTEEWSVSDYGPECRGDVGHMGNDHPGSATWHYDCRRILRVIRRHQLSLRRATI